MAKKASVRDCLDEIRRLRAENERLHRLIGQQRPELGELRDLEVALRDYLDGGAKAIERCHQLAKELLVANHDLPTFAEVSGCLSDGRDRVFVALGEAMSINAVDPSAADPGTPTARDEDSSSPSVSPPGRARETAE